MENLRQYNTGQIERCRAPRELRLDAARDSTQALLACSACAGDYEDPERSAWTAQEEDGELDVPANGADQERESGVGRGGANTRSAADDGFPA